MARTTFRNVITTPDKISDINPQNQKLVDGFLKVKGIQSSLGTIFGYHSDLNIFFVYVLEHFQNKFFVDIRKVEVAEFFSFCSSELQWGSNRFNRMRGCLSSLSDYIERYLDDDYPLFHNYIIKTIDSMPENLRREKTILTELQISQLLQWLKDTNRKQEACLAALAVSCGARASELARFTTDLIDFNNLVYSDVFIETTKPIKTKGKTRNGNLKYQYIIKAIFESPYREWIEERQQILSRRGLFHDFIFIQADGSPATVYTLRAWMKNWGEFLGVPVYPHAFRHYAVTFLTRIGLPSELICELMGWKSSEMFKIYNDLTGKDRKWKELDILKKYLEE